MGADLVAILIGFFLFPIIVFLPGYAIGSLTDILRFRSRTLSFRLAASAPIAIAIAPVLSYALGSLLSLNAAALVFCGLSVYSVILFSRIPRGGFHALFTELRVFLTLIGAWIAIAMLSLSDLQIGRRLYFSITAFDYAIRTAFTQSIAVYGLPARNPFFYPGHAVGLRYHYFWFIVCSVVHRMSHGLVDARQALIAGSVWCGIGFICLIPLYLRLFTNAGSNRLRRRSLVTILLLGVTGLDLLPALFMIAGQSIGIVKGMSPSVEWWNNQIDGWLYTMLWEPHYVCAVIACFTGFLILWDLDARSSSLRRLVSAALAGLAFASAVGAGIYVTFVFAVFLVVWTAIAIWNKWWIRVLPLLLAGLFAGICSLPYLISLHTASGSSQGSLFQLTIRSFEFGEMFLKIFRIDKPWQLIFANTVLLPLNYFLELGIFFVAGIARMRAAKPFAGSGAAAWTLVACSVCICTVLKSGLIANNDLGWRGFLIAQFVLLLWGGELLSDLPARYSRRRRVFIHGLVVIGAAGVVYDLAILRFFPLLSDQNRVPKIAWLSNDEQLGLRTYANREAYEWLRGRFSVEAVVQQDPTQYYQDTMFGLYGQRQTVAEDEKCGTIFGGDPGSCESRFKLLQALYSSPVSDSFPSACAALPVDVFVAKDTDAAWKDRASWIWTRTPAFKNDFVRVFPCRPKSL